MGDERGDSPSCGGAPPAPGCADAETIAAYVDGRLSSAERASLIAHLADCEDCRDLAVEVSAARDEVERPAAPSLPAARRRPAAAGLLALAAALIVAVFVSRELLDRFGADSDRGALVAAVGARRPVEGRLTGGFRHGPLAAQMRAGDSEPTASPGVVIAVAQAEQSLARRRSWRSLWMFGTAQLVSGHVDAAIRALEEAKALRPDSAGVEVDLSAAYLERARFVPSSDVQACLAKGVESASQAVRRSPEASEAWFNLAILQQRAGLPGAEDSWRTYLRLERDEAWQQEGRRQLATLAPAVR